MNRASDLRLDQEAARQPSQRWLQIAGRGCQRRDGQKGLRLRVQSAPTPSMGATGSMSIPQIPALLSREDRDSLRRAGVGGEVRDRLLPLPVRRFQKGSRSSCESLEGRSTEGPSSNSQPASYFSFGLIFFVPACKLIPVTGKVVKAKRCAHEARPPTSAYRPLKVGPVVWLGLLTTSLRSFPQLSVGFCSCGFSCPRRASGSEIRGVLLTTLIPHPPVTRT